MTNAEVHGLQAGDRLVEIFNGIWRSRTVVRVKSTGRCINPCSGAFGHSWALVELQADGTDLRFTVAIHSDEYAAGEGYPSHKGGQRIRGWELVSQEVGAAA